jgi:hypothetical protein
MSKVGVWFGALGLLCSIGCGKSDESHATDGGATADGPLFHIDRSKNSDVGTTNPLDYSDPNLWVCRPGIDANPCYGDHGELDTTELLPDGTTKLLKHIKATAPEFDCFYVYPTVYLQGSGNRTDLNDITYVMDALMAQGARLSQICEVYAPLYRQVVITPGAISAGLSDGGQIPTGTGSGGAGGSDNSAGRLSGTEAGIAVGDVRAAFAYYLQHLNKGRKFVLMGHSQGSGMLIGMMQQDVDPVPEVRAKMISALLLGGGATVATGKKVGGSFQNVPLCSSPGEKGCVVAYSSFDSAKPPDATALFGRASGGQDVACNDPSMLNGGTGLYEGSYFPMHLANALLAPSNPHMPDPGTAFILYRNAFQGKCVNQGGYSYLNITLQEAANDPRGVPPYHSAAETIGFGLHLVDWALPMQDIIEMVTKQAAP